MKAIISDIHGNLEALESVLEDIERQGIKEIYCLGDIIGYGPNQGDCIDLVMQHCEIAIMGNHEADYLSIFNSQQQDSEVDDFFYYSEIDPRDSQFESRFRFISNLPRFHTEDHCLFVHASARDTQFEYVLPGDVSDDKKMSELFSRIDHVCFQGHTHIPGVFTECRRFFYGNTNPFLYPVKSEKLMVCVGSVGQPRDGNKLACYAIHTGSDVIIRRVSYDYKKTIAKMNARTVCNAFFGARLASGR